MSDEHVQRAADAVIAYINALGEENERLRAALAWALDYIDDAVVGLPSDATFEKLEELRALSSPVSEETER